MRYAACEACISSLSIRYIWRPLQGRLSICMVSCQWTQSERKREGRWLHEVSVTISRAYLWLFSKLKFLPQIRSSKVSVNWMHKWKRHEGVLWWKQKRYTCMPPNFRRVQLMRLQKRQLSTRASTADSIRSRPDLLSLALGKEVEKLTLSSSSQCELGKNESKHVDHNDQSVLNTTKLQIQSFITIKMFW